MREGVWDIYQEVPEDYVNGYAYAIATGSATILSYYQQRCLANVNKKVAVHMRREKQLQGSAAAAAAASTGQGFLGNLVSKARGFNLERLRVQQEQGQQGQLGAPGEREMVELEQGGLRGAAVEGVDTGGSGNWDLGTWGSAAGRRGGAGAAALGKKAADECIFHIDYS